MPGALPARRMRRDAPRPSVLRGNAVNSMFMDCSGCLRPSFGASSFLRKARPVVRLVSSDWRHFARGLAADWAGNRKALNYNTNTAGLLPRQQIAQRFAPRDYIRTPWVRMSVREQRTDRFLVRDACHRFGQQLGAGKLADARTGFGFRRQRDRIG